jgi:uncharacterized protein (TIGR02757 family)
MKRMGGQPYRFVLDHSGSDLKGLLGFKHRTFQEEDLFYFIRFLHHHYTLYPSLETAFLGATEGKEPTLSLEGFYNHFFNLTDVPRRTRKHISHPGTLSTCKRLCMYLRWMIRPGKKGVDFGLWQRIKPSQLYIPLDVHVHRVAGRLGLLNSEKKNWSAVTELTRNLRALDPEDPVKYDFALFNLGQLKHPL